MKIYVVKRQGGSIMPMHDSDKAVLDKFQVGDIFEVDVVKPRNVKFHRKAMALFNLVYENQEVYSNMNDLRYDITVEAGYFVEGVNIHGEIVRRAKSISFASMDEIEFGQYYDDCIKTIVLHFNFDREDLINEVAQYF